SFRQLLVSLPANGLLVAADHPGVRAVLGESRAPVQTYGFAAPAEWTARAIAVEGDGTGFDVWRSESRLGRLWLPLFGNHNVENALGVTALAVALGLDLDEIRAGMREFRGVRR